MLKSVIQKLDLHLEECPKVVSQSSYEKNRIKITNYKLTRKIIRRYKSIKNERLNMIHNTSFKQEPEIPELAIELPKKTRSKVNFPLLPDINYVIVDEDSDNNETINDENTLEANNESDSSIFGFLV